MGLPAENWLAGLCIWKAGWELATARNTCKDDSQPGPRPPPRALIMLCLPR